MLPGAVPGKCPRADSGSAGVGSEPGDWSLDAILVCLTADHYPRTAIAGASGQAPWNCTATSSAQVPCVAGSYGRPVMCVRVQAGAHQT